MGFCQGDPGMNAYFSNDKLLYTAIVRNPSEAGGARRVIRNEVDPGCFVAEASLWTAWTHRGDLMALEKETVIFYMITSEFARLVAHNLETRCFCASYAEEFLIHLDNLGIATDMCLSSFDHLRRITLGAHGRTYRQV